MREESHRHIGNALDRKPSCILETLLAQLRRHLLRAAGASSTLGISRIRSGSPATSESSRSNRQLDPFSPPPRERSITRVSAKSVAGIARTSIKFMADFLRDAGPAPASLRRRSYRRAI